MTSVRRDAVPRVNVFVRRRKFEDAKWLVLKNRFVRLDEKSDAVWLACEESLSVEHIIERFAAQFSVPLKEAIMSVSYLIDRFREERLIEIDYCDGEGDMR